MAASKAVLVTGCRSGIGRATALRLARSSGKRGWTVWASARKKDTLGELETAGCRTIDLDINDDGFMTRAVRAVEAEHGSVGVLVNNAGYGHSGAIEVVSMEQVRKQFETNVFGLVRLTQLVLPRMRAQREGRMPGFEDPNSFYRAFRAWNGKSPSAFRRRPLRRGRT